MNIKILTIVSIIKPNIIYTSARIGLANRNTSIELSYNGVKLYIKSKLYYHNTKLQLIDRFTTSLNLEPLVGSVKKAPFLTVHGIVYTISIHYFYIKVFFIYRIK
jgi:hypothetical protein